jgi:hypothetical protein
MMVTLLFLILAQGNPAPSPPQAEASRVAGSGQDDAPPPPSSPAKKSAEEAVPKQQEENPPEKPKLEPVQPKRHHKLAEEYAFKAGLAVEYNDNVIRLDKRDIEAFDAGSNPDKFRITSVGDTIYHPWGEVETYFPFFGHRATGGLRVEGWIYETNGFMNTELFVLFLRERAFEAELRYTPSVYQREYRNLDTGLFESAFYADFEGDAEYKFPLTEDIVFRPKIAIEYKNYDAPFKYRDAMYYGFEPRVTARVMPEVAVFAEYRFVLADSYATDIQPDVSYIQNGVGVGVHYNPTKRVETRLTAEYDRREYTTSNSPFIDPNHAGRVDDRIHYRAKAEWRLSEEVHLELRYGYTHVLTNKPFRPDIIDEEWSWIRNDVTIGISYKF